LPGENWRTEIPIAPNHLSPRNSSIGPMCW
jgi:hypothetical protein